MNCGGLHNVFASSVIVSNLAVGIVGRYLRHGCRSGVFDCHSRGNDLMALTGFLVHGICAKDSTAALYALGQAFPQFLGSTPPVMCNLSGQSFTSPSTFSQTISCHDLLSSAQRIFVHPISLPACDPALAGVTLSDIFSIPSTPDVTQVWMIAFTLPLILWLVAWGFGVVVNMFRDDDK